MSRRAQMALTLLGLQLGCAAPEPDSLRVPVAKPESPPHVASAALASASAPRPEASMVAEANKTAPEVRARAFVSMLERGEYGAAVGQFDGVMAEALPAAKLQAVWEGLGRQVGALRRIGDVRTEKQGAYLVALVRCEFAHAELDAKLAFDREGRVSGLFFIPPPPPYAYPDYVAEDRFEETEVTVGAAPLALPGTLTLPKGTERVAAVVLVHGSGPQDRDESVGANKPFRDLAAGLASRGIAVLRYDKRTKVHPEACVAEPNFTVMEETVIDAGHAVRLLAGHPRVDAKRIGVLGHSMGGTFAPRIAEHEPSVARIVILAGAARKIPEMMLAQLDYLSRLDGRVSPEETQQIDEVKAALGRIAEIHAGAPPREREMILGAFAPYWLDYERHDPLAAAKRLGKPIFIAQGEADYQVTAKEDFAAWQKALQGMKGVSFKLYPNANHLFGQVEGKSSPEHYAQRTPVAKELVDDVAAFLLGKPVR